MTLRRHTTIGEEAVCIMLLACHGTVWEHKNIGKYTFVYQDGSERVVDGFSLGDGTQLIPDEPRPELENYSAGETIHVPFEALVTRKE